MAGPRATSRRRNRAFLALALGAFGVAVVLGVLYAVPFSGAVAPERATLQGTSSRGFPDCAQVTVDWRVIAGGPVAFLYAQSAQETSPSDCHGSFAGAADANCSCPPSYCPPNTVSLGPGPICYQSGTSGSSGFVATQPLGYTFWEVEPNSTTPSNDSIAVTFGVAAPLVPSADRGAVFGGAAAGLLVGAVATAQLLRGRAPRERR